MSASLELVVVTRRECGLCAEMEEVVAPFAGQPDVALRTVDADADAALAAAYGADVPVLLINGRRAFKYRVEAHELRRRLRAERRRMLLRRWRELLNGGPAR